MLLRATGADAAQDHDSFTILPQFRLVAPMRMSFLSVYEKIEAQDVFGYLVKMAVADRDVSDKYLALALKLQ